MSRTFAEMSRTELGRLRESAKNLTPEQRLQLTVELSARSFAVIRGLPNQVQVQAQIAAIDEANRLDFLERMAEIVARIRAKAGQPEDVDPFTSIHCPS